MDEGFDGEAISHAEVSWRGGWIEIEAARLADQGHNRHQTGAWLHNRRPVLNCRQQIDGVNT